MKTILSLLTALLFVSFNSSYAGLASVKNCTITQEKDFRSIATYIKNHWRGFERYLERETDLNIKKCIKNRFKKNGKILCKSSNTGMCDGANGWAVPGAKKIRLCPSFLNRISRYSKNNRRACYLALMAHEFSHSCFRTERDAELIDDASFDYWDSTHTLSIVLRDCGMD